MKLIVCRKLPLPVKGLKIARITDWMKDNFIIWLKSMAVSLHYCRVAFNKIKALFVGGDAPAILFPLKDVKKYLSPTQISLNFGLLVASDLPC